MTSDLIYHTDPFDHQREVLERMHGRPYYGLFMEMGTGKSKILIDDLYNMYVEGKATHCLYIAKKGEFANFHQYEIAAHWKDPDTINSRVYNGYHTRAQQKNLRESLMYQGPKFNLLSINVEAIRSGKGYEFARVFCQNAKGKLVIIIDESTCIKDKNSKQTKAALKLRDFARYRRVSTGTVIPNTPVDVWTQCEFLKKGSLGIKTMTAFKAEYHKTEMQFFGSRKFAKYTGPRNIEDLSDRMSQFGTLMEKKDCVDLPPKIYTRKMVELTDAQRKAYQELYDFHVTQMPDGQMIEAVNALSLRMKFHQIVCGQVRHRDGHYYLLPNNRMPLCTDICEEILDTHKKVIVWSHYIVATLALKEQLEEKFGVVHLKGGLKTEDRTAFIDQFKKDPKTQIFLANPQSSGFGLTLTESSYAVYYNNTDNMEHRLQSEDRTHRIGQTLPCTYIDLHAPGTVDDDIIDNVTGKKNTRKAFFSKDDMISMLQLREG